MPRSTRRPRVSRAGAAGGMLDVRVEGVERLALVTRRLREAGDKGLRTEMYRGLRRSAKPLIADTREYARRTLPKRGGLNERVARSKFRVSVRGSGRNPGVRITATGLDTRLDTRGVDRHPVFGNRDVWVTQKVKPHWFESPMRAGSPKVRRELDRVISDVAKQLEGR